MYETNLTLVGTVITDVRDQRLASGVRRVSFRMACNERRFDRSSDQWVNGDRVFMNVTCWRRLAGNVGGALGKGDPVIVSGRLRTRDYEVEGQRRSTTELEANSVGPDLGRCTASVWRSRRLARPPSSAFADSAEAASPEPSATERAAAGAEVGGDSATLAQTAAGQVEERPIGVGEAMTENELTAAAAPG